MLAHADLEDLTLERDLHHEKARLEPRWAELVYDGMWFSPLKQAIDAFVDESTAPRDRRGAAALRAARYRGGDRSAQPGRPVRPRAGHLRRRATPSATRTPRDSSGSGAWAWPLGGPGRARRRLRHDPVAGPAGRRHGRRGGGLHGQPAGSTRRWPRTTWPARGPMCEGLGKAGILTADEVAILLEHARTGWATSWPTGDLRVPPGRRGRPHGGRAPGDRAGRGRRGQAAHRAQPQRPGGDRPAAVVPARA